MSAIFRREFQSYFHSVIGYIFISVFLVFASYFFLFANIASLSSDIRNLFYNLITILVFLIPILTMRCLSEERRSKTDQILLTSPVSVKDIVLGKYLAALCVFLIAIACTLVFPLILYAYGRPETGVILTVYTGFILLGAVFISIGLLVSALTENQVIAAILTFGILLFVQLFDSIKGAISSPAIVKVIEWLSLKERYGEFDLGIFNFEHIIYFITLIAIINFLTVQVIEKRRWS